MKTKLPRPATFPAVVRLTYADIYGFNFAIDPGAALPAPGSDPKTWSAFPVATVVRLAPYHPAEATREQQEQYDTWVDNDPANDPNPEYRTDDPSPSYWFCAVRSDEAHGETDSGNAYRVEVLPGFLCGVDE